MYKTNFSLNFSYLIDLFFCYRISWIPGQWFKQAAILKTHTTILQSTIAELRLMRNYISEYDIYREKEFVWENNPCDTILTALNARCYWDANYSEFPRHQSRIQHVIFLFTLCSNCGLKKNSMCRTCFSDCSFELLYFFAWNETCWYI